MKKIIVFDNNGETFDRYTILDKSTGEMYGASENPFHPQGFGQYCGNVADNYWFHAYGASWRKHCDVKKCERFAIRKFINEFEGNNIVDISTLPDAVKQYIKQVTTNQPA